MPMELRQLRYVAAVARERHFTRAAEGLHVAQSALSHQVRRLEAELGVELFERTSRRVELTAAGELVATRAGRVLAEVEALQGDLHRLSGVMHGSLSVGGMLPFARVDWAGLLGDFQDRHPDVTISLREGTASDAVELLRRDEVDVAFAFSPPGALPPEIAGIELASEELAVIVAPGHRLARARSVRLEELAGEPFVGFYRGAAMREAVEQAFAAAGLEPVIRFESNQLDTVRALASRGLGVSILPRSFVESEGPPVAVLSAAPPIERPTIFLWRAARSLPPAAEAFLAFVRESRAV